MKYLVILLLILVTSCKEHQKKETIKNDEITTVSTEEYELVKASDANTLLIIFPGGGSSIEQTKEEFKIIDKALANRISVLILNYNSNLWIDQEDKEYLSKLLNTIVKENKLNTDNIYIGGMSLGGTVSLSIANFLTTETSTINPKGIFVVDAPIDLYALYESSQKDVARKDFSEERLAEPKWIINYFEEEFGGKDSLIDNIQKVAPVTYSRLNIDNIKKLKDKKLRFYTEPDTLWWLNTRKTDFSSTNAYTLQLTDKLLRKINWKNAELIQTKNKGYRSDGTRNPHSWSIVDTDDLIEWIQKK